MTISKKTLYIFDKLVLFTLMFLVMGFAVQYKQIEYQCNIGAFDKTPWAKIVPDEDPGLINRILFKDYGHYKIETTNYTQFSEQQLKNLKNLNLVPAGTIQ